MNRLQMIYTDPAAPNEDKTVISINNAFLQQLLSGINIPIPSTNIILQNNLDLNDRIRLGNWFMTLLAVEIGKVDVPMTRKELIEKLKEFDETDPNGELEVTFANNIQITDVNLQEAGKDKWIEIV